MTIEVIAIGSELLVGVTVNTNAAFISQELAKEGFRVSRHTVVADEPSIIRKTFQQALEHADIVISTGGLGPTCDDLTRNIAAELYHSDLYYNEELGAELEKRYGELYASIKDQAVVPSKAALLKNMVGSAPGMVFEEGGKVLILLPGVPVEMRTMLCEEVLPYLRHRFANSKRFFGQRVHLFGLPESAIDPLLRRLQPQYPKVEFGIYPAHGTVSVQLTAEAEKQQIAADLFAEPLSIIKKEFSANLYDSPSGKIEEAIHQCFIERGWTLSVAESCTGGSMAARLTQLPGASRYFLGGIVTYSNKLKSELLGVSEKLLESKGAVSGEVAEAMVRGLLKKTQSTFGVAITGIAGPDGGTPEKPVGTIWAAIAHNDKPPYVWKFEARGNREKIIEMSVTKVLGELLKYLFTGIA